MINILKSYENRDQMHGAFSPAVDVANGGIVKVSNLKKLRIGCIIKFETNSEGYGLVLTLNTNGTAEILVLTNNEVSKNSIREFNIKKKKLMINILKSYENRDQMHGAFSPAVDAAKDGIVTVSNLKQLRIGSLIKFKTNSEDYRLVSTLNTNGTAEILVLTNNEVSKNSIREFNIKKKKHELGRY